MKRIFAFIIVLCLCMSMLGCQSERTKSNAIDQDDEYDRGWNDGYDLGYYDGYEEGTNSGSEEDRYEEGYDDGYYAGATYTCMFFGDIERAFKCAKNGSAWYALIDAYDQYEYDIYDDGDKETRSKLFWALVSYASEEGATKEEYNLLYSAFSTDLDYLD